MTTSTAVQVSQRGRSKRMVEEHEHDTYRARRKPRQPTTCPDCGAVFLAGRWQWAPPPETASEELCPACRRVHDRLPAALLTVEGEFLASHRDEIMALIQNLEAKEKAERPLHRIMGIDSNHEAAVVAFTDPHLARAAGAALAHAYKGELEIDHQAGEATLRVHWRR